MDKMKRWMLVLLVAALCAAQISGVGMADGAKGTVFDFVNVYDKPTTQSTLSASELLALTRAPNDRYETACATYTLKQYAFDGCNVYLSGGCAEERRRAAYVRLYV